MPFYVQVIVMNNNRIVIKFVIVFFTIKHKLMSFTLANHLVVAYTQEKQLLHPLCTFCVFQEPNSAQEPSA